MSLLSSEQLLVSVHERGIDALHVRRNLLSRRSFVVHERQRFDVARVASDDDNPPGSDPASAKAPPWQGSVALLRELSAAGVKHMQLVLSNHFVRYLLLPWESIVACNGDTQALARAQFQLAFGEAASSWRVLADEPRFRTDCLALAIDGQLLNMAHDMAAAAGMQIAGLRPHLLAALRRWRGALKQQAIHDAGWFAVFEPGRLTVLGSHRGRAHSLRNIRLHAAYALMPTLHQCLAADRLKTSLTGSVCLHAPGWEPSGERTAHPEPDGFVRLDETHADAGRSDFGLAMAYCGAS